MRAYVTSIGEATTSLSVWSLERLGFEVILIEDAQTTLWDKLLQIFKGADDDFLRVDADVIVNRNILDMVKYENDLVWTQALTYDWHKQDITHGGIQFIRKEAIQSVRNHIYEAKWRDRPESYLYRLREFHQPRVCGTFEKVCGLNGYGQDDVERVKQVKLRRMQYDNYDFELSERISQL